MFTERLERIKSFTLGISVRMRETYFINNGSDLHQEIINFCSDIKDLNFVQKIWHWVNDNPNYYLCDCGNKTTFHKNWLDGYRKNCSAKCAQVKDEAKSKRKETNLLKWGVDNVARSQQVKEKQMETNLEKYGTKSSFQNESVKNKYKETIKKKYNTDHYFKTDEFKLKTKQYYLKKWGVEHQSLSIEIQNKIKETCLNKYGVTTYLKTDHARESIVKYNTSSAENEIIDWLKSINIPISTTDRIIKPYTLDIYLPNHKVAIEFNGLYWHSELFKEKNYHYEKTRLCNQQGIELLHIWEDDWRQRKEIIKSIILNKLKLLNLKVWARKCKIMNIDNQQASDFLNRNHIQGYSRFKKAYALFYNEEIVSVMTFGWRAINGRKAFELLRFANKINYNVVGAASKLFKYALKEDQIDEVVSYSDTSLFNGKLYETLNFKFIHNTPVNYWWVVKGVRYHRFTFNKKKLVNKGHDSSKTEVEIMRSLGNYRIWGCGQGKWIWKR